MTFGGELKGPFKNLKYFEQRSDEIKQLEEQKETYENVFKDFVIVDQNFEIIESGVQFRRGHIGEFYSDPSLFELFLSEIKTTGTDSEKTYLLTSAEVFNGKSLHIQESETTGAKKTLATQQITAILKKSDNYIKTLNKCFVAYRSTESSYSKYLINQAVNYASDGKS